MNKSLSHQYDNIATEFSDALELGNVDSRAAYNEVLPEDLSGRKILDLGSGNGFETNLLSQLGADYVLGIDASRELLMQAKESYPELDFKYGLFEDVPSESDSFDYVFSKYALQTASDLEPIWNEVFRVLKPGGYFVLLVAHPLRQFIEKKKQPKDYFEKEIVESICFDGKLTFEEPTHTLKEYFSSFMLDHFILEAYDERFDSAAEQIVDTYPGFLLLKWKKKS